MSTLLWLGEIRSCDSLAGCKLLILCGFIQFSCLFFLFHLPKNFLASYHPVSFPPQRLLSLKSSQDDDEGVDSLTNNCFLLTRGVVPAFVGYGSFSLPDLRETREWDLRLEQRGY